MFFPSQLKINIYKKVRKKKISGIITDETSAGKIRGPPGNCVPATHVIDSAEIRHLSLARCVYPCKIKLIANSVMQSEAVIKSKRLRGH